MSITIFPQISVSNPLRLIFFSYGVEITKSYYHHSLLGLSNSNLLAKVDSCQTPFPESFATIITQGAVFTLKTIICIPRGLTLTSPYVEIILTEFFGREILLWYTIYDTSKKKSLLNWSTISLGMTMIDGVGVVILHLICLGRHLVVGRLNSRGGVAVVPKTRLVCGWLTVIITRGMVG